MTEQEDLDAIRGCYDDLERWRVRAAAQPPEQPQANSELAKDDAIFDFHRISEAGRLSLIAAGEHLRLSRDAVEAHQLYPSAHFEASWVSRRLGLLDFG